MGNDRELELSPPKLVPGNEAGGQAHLLYYFVRETEPPVTSDSTMIATSGRATYRRYTQLHKSYMSLKVEDSISLYTRFVALSHNRWSLAGLKPTRCGSSATAFVLLWTGTYIVHEVIVRFEGSRTLYTAAS